jgi:hypothetical protein
VQSVLTITDSGPSDPSRTASGHLADSTGAPIAGASIMLSDIPWTGSYAQYQLSGQAPTAAALAIVGFRVNTDNANLIWPTYWFAGPEATSFSLYQVSYVQTADGIDRVPNGDFSAGAQSWSLQGQTQIVPSDRGAGQMVQVVATPSQFATLDSVPFAVTAGASFQLSFSAIPAPSGGAVHAEAIPLTAANNMLGTTTTDSAGNFQFSLTSLGSSQVTLEASYAGDTRHWPAYAQTSP